MLYLVDHTRSVVVGLNLPFKFRVDQISIVSELLRFFRFWSLSLKWPIHAHFLLGGGGWGLIFFQMKSPVILISKRHLRTSFEPLNVSTMPRFDLWRGSRKRTGQSKSHKSVIFHVFGEKPPPN